MNTITVYFFYSKYTILKHSYQNFLLLVFFFFLFSAPSTCIFDYFVCGNITSCYCSIFFPMTFSLVFERLTLSPILLYTVLHSSSIVWISLKFSKISTTSSTNLSWFENSLIMLFPFSFQLSSLSFSCWGQTCVHFLYNKTYYTKLRKKKKMIKLHFIIFARKIKKYSAIKWNDITIRNKAVWNFIANIL